MSVQVTIRQHAGPVAVETGETVLAAALRQGVDYPHGCRSGNCGACKSRLFAGEVDLMPFSDYALRAEERQNGLILACRAVPWSDAEVAWLAADETVAHPRRTLACRVVARDRLTHDVVRVRLEIEGGGPFTFSAGQYASLSFAGCPPRDYSMANCPDEAILEFHIRHLPGGAAGDHVARGLAVGDPVKVEGPFGLSYLRELHTGPILAIAGGSGLAPIRAIVATALAKGALQPIHLFFGVRDERDVYAEDELRRMAAAHPNLDVTIVLSDPDGPTERPTGLVHEAAAAQIPDLDGCKAYIAGPPPMVDAASALLRARGLRAEDLHADPFTPAETS